MAVVIETTLGDLTVDLFLKERPRACQNFLKLCKSKYYNYNLFHTVSRGFIAQTGDPTGSRNGGESIFGVLEGPLKRFFVAETNPRIKHTIMGLVSFVGNEESMIGSQFFFTLGDELTYLDGKHCVFGQVTEGLDVLELINEAICDSDDRPYQDIRITHTVVLDDPLPDLERMIIPSRSPSPSAERLQGGRIAPDEEIDETAGKSLEEVNEIIAEREAKARATILEMVGDLPDAEMAPPENVLFVCKLNPVTSDDDLEIIFSRFGKIKSCEVIRDHKTGDSLQYAFVEFEEQKSCEDAYFKMDNVLIDDRRIHVDFSQSVSKIKWMGKGRGVKHFDDNEKNSNRRNDRDEYKRKYSRSRSPEQRRNSSKVHDTKSNRRTSRRSPPSFKYQSDRKYGDRNESPERRKNKNEKSKHKKYPKSRDRSSSESFDEKRSRKYNDSRKKIKSKRNNRDSSSSHSSDREKRDNKGKTKIRDRRLVSSSPERYRKEKKRRSVSSDDDEQRKRKFERKSKKTPESPQRYKKNKKSLRSSSSDSSSEREERSTKRKDRKYENYKNETSKDDERRRRRSRSYSRSPVSRKSKKDKYRKRSVSPRRRK